MHINPARTGLVVGFVLGLWHAAWSLIVALGWAQALVDFILRLHFMRMSLEIQPFDAVTAMTLIGVTFVIGLAIGVVFAVVWNGLHSKQPT